MSQHDNSLIKTPRQLIIVIALAFIVPVILIILLATYVVRSTTSGSRGLRCDERKGDRRAHAAGGVGRVRGFRRREIFANRRSGLCGSVQCLPRSRHRGRAAHRRRCCVGAAHQAGISICWSSTPSKDSRRCLPKGGNSNLDPIEVARAVAFMGNQSGGKFKEPAAPQPVRRLPLPAPAATAARCRRTVAAALRYRSQRPLRKGARSTAKVDGAKVLCVGLQRVSRGRCCRRTEVR